MNLFAHTTAIRLLLCFGIACVGPATAASTYYAVNDFQSTNPSGPWSYGSEVTLGGTFSLLSVFTPASSNSTGDIEAWSYAAGYPDGSATPYIGHNTLTTTDTFFHLPADLLQLHPGDPTSTQPMYVVLRWTSPLSAGTVDVSGLFSSMFNPGATTDAYILVDGIALPLYSFTFSGVGADHNFGLTVPVTLGTTIDFVIGPHGDYNGDSTGLNVTISDVPEPAAGLWVAAGLLSLGLLRRVRQH